MICNRCGNNNNGWCKVFKINGLKKLDTQVCNKFKCKYKVDWSTFESMDNITLKQCMFSILTDYETIKNISLEEVIKDCDLLMESEEG